jgi:uncharacterized protein (DUF362 family)
MLLQHNWVFCAKAPAVCYGPYPCVQAPELPTWAQMTTALACLRSLFSQAGLDRRNLGSVDWNPLRSMINDGDRVVIKPNWVYHRNGSGHGLDSLVTHADVIEAILHYVSKAQPRSIVICDAPVQGCDFEALMSACRVSEMIERFRADGVSVVVKDLRRTIRRTESLCERPHEGCRPIKDYVLYDLGLDSSLEEITSQNSEFRVTMYDPNLLKARHALGKHQYLVARDVIEADVVVNVPKLKTHKKACISGALKNVVGINGHKEYLPHHRKGCFRNGGDCYPSRSHFKSIIEEVLDRTNRAQGAIIRRLLGNVAQGGMALGKFFGIDNNYDGSWHGNDTVWRMSLDLQRVLHYGLADGTLSNHQQRKVLTITDAIVAGQGDGPLSPTAVGFGMLTMGTNTAAVEWIHALLMGLNPQRIALTREAFIPHRYPLADFTSKSIVVHVDGARVPTNELFRRYGVTFQLPKGWAGHAELGSEKKTHKETRQPWPVN